MFIGIEEAGVVPPRCLAELDNSRFRIQWRARFVEGDMAIAPDPEELDIEASGAHQAVVAPGLFVEVRGSAIGGKCCLTPQIDKISETPHDDVSVGLGMLCIESDVLVQQIDRRLRKTQ